MANYAVLNNHTIGLQLCNVTKLLQMFDNIITESKVFYPSSRFAIEVISSSFCVKNE